MKNIKYKIITILLLLYSTAFWAQETESIIDAVSIDSQLPSNGKSCPPCRPTYTYSQIELDLVYLFNQYRQEHSLSTVSLINHISNNCLDHANYMIAAGASSHDYFTDRTYNIQCALGNPVSVGEIVAFNYYDAYVVFSAWLNSPGHLAIIEKPAYTRVGISVRQDSLNRKYYAVIFSGNTTGSCSVIQNPCSLSPPVTLTTTNINDTSAQLNWYNVTGNNGYEIQYKTTASGPYAWLTAGSVGTNVTTYTKTGLTALTAYKWRVRSKCANGYYGVFSNVANFTTNCIVNLNLSTAITSGQTSYKEASNSVTSSSIINSGGTGVFHAGVFVLLSNNFHAKNGSAFRAYIEGCSGTFIAKQASNDEVSETVLDKVTSSLKLKIAPNPNKGIFDIPLENFNEVKIQITDLYGTIVYEANFKNQDKAQINIENTSKGIYILKLNADGKTYVEKLIKN